MSTSLLATPEQLRASFTALTNPRDLAGLLEISYSQFVYHVLKTPDAAKYVEFSLPKRSAGFRTIRVPATPLKLIQRKLNQVLQACMPVSQGVHGFVLGRNVLTNAAVHVGRRLVLNLDLADFFESINFGRVRGLFMAGPYNLPPSVATAIAQIACHANSLPQGAPTSPAISNLICRSLDRRLRQAAVDNRCFYSRYADDITFSTNRAEFPTEICDGRDGRHCGPASLGTQLTGIIEESGFRINPEKTVVADRHSRQRVTGLIVNDRPNVQRSLRRQIRGMLFAWSKFGLAGAQKGFEQRGDSKHRAPGRVSADYRRVLRGKIEFVGLVRGRTDEFYQRTLSELAGLDPDFKPRATPRAKTEIERILEGKVWVVETDTRSLQGTAFLLEGVGAVTVAHVLGEETVAFSPADPFTRRPVIVVSYDEDLDLALISWDGMPASTSGLRRKVGGDNQLLQTVYAIGFPHYRNGDTWRISSAQIAAFRSARGHPRILVTSAIIAGMSGGPVLDDRGRVLGVAVTGMDSATDPETEDHGVIPINGIDLLLRRRRTRFSERNEGS